MTTSTNSLRTSFVAQINRLTAKGATASDVKRIDKYASDNACAFVQGAIDANIVAQMSNQKAIMRTAQAVSFIASGTVDSLDLVTGCIVATIALSKQNKITFSDLHYLAGGKGNQDTAHVRGVSREKLRKFIGLTSNMGTVTSKVSRSVGKNGLFSALGITTKCDAHGFEINPEAKNHPFVIAYAARIEALTDGQFALLAEKTK